MWPFGGESKVRKKLARGEHLDGPSLVELVVTIVSPNILKSPETGTEAVYLEQTLVERVAVKNPDGGNEIGDAFLALGRTWLGTEMTVETADGATITIRTQGATEIVFASGYESATPLSKTSLPASLAEYASRASSQGFLCFREQVLRTGDRLRFEGTVEMATAVVASGYRSGSETTFIAKRGEPARLVEILETPNW